MTDEYIENNYDLIFSHRSDIEYRGDDADCTADTLKEDNRNVIAGFQQQGEQITLIDKDYEKALKKLMDNF